MKARSLLTLLGICWLFFWDSQAFATHVRAGEITTRRISNTSLTYEITVTVYYDEANGRAAASQANDLDICFGDGTPAAKIPRREIRAINRNTTINVYRITHTYPGPGTYNIVTIITNRNDNTRNIPNSVNTTFELRTTIVVNAPLGLNSTPVMLNPPLDSARTGQKFCHNPAAFDIDGDSLAYRLFTPSGQQGWDQTCRPTRFVNGYQRPELIGTNPTTEAGTGQATLTIDPVTGDLCWDAPAEKGQYNIAFIIEEYRNGVKIGEIVRDMQIIVVDGQNRRPQVQVPPDLCVEAGTVINQTITATDPDGNRLQFTAYGGVFNVGPDGRPYLDPVTNQPVDIVASPFATFTPSSTQIVNSPATGTFRWQTNCAHVRDEPYDVIIRVVDQPRNQTQLTTIESFRIRVYAPRPQNLTARPGASAQGRAITLNWSAYNCAQPGAEMVIYRREGCTSVPVDPCITGIPASAGYTEIGRVPIGTTTFTDSQNLRRGAQYSYRIVASFARPRGGESVVSAEACVSLPLQVPLMTNVTVDTTDATRGVVTVRWTRPIGLQASDLGGPFQYRLFRAPGIAPSAGADFVQVATINTNLSPAAADTVYTDRGLNTTGNGFRYRVEFYYTDPATGQFTRLDVTDAASSVLASATGGTRQVRISWQANTPWDNTGQRHRVYRSRRGPNGPFNQIAEVAVQGTDTFNYTDTGVDNITADGVESLTLSPDSSYCYRVETVGRYTNPPVNLPQLRNFSQAICASPIDTTRPCPPTLTLDTLNCATLSPDAFCNQTSFTNNLSWQPATVGPNNRPCDTRIVGYNVYYTRYREDSEHQRLTQVAAPSTTFQHNSLTSVAGCYYVTAVTRGGLESAPSNRVCKDICPALRLPNVITPNGDGRNDVFQPLPCPRGVEGMEFVVYNRYGAKVFETTDVNINWTGKGTNGQDLPAGLYYYQANVRFGGVSRQGSSQTYKGWVEVIRETTR